MNAACCLFRIEQCLRINWSRVIAFHRQCIYSIIFLTFLFTPKELFMRPIKQAFISLPTAWIDSEVVRLWLDYTWSSSYSICVALLCLRVVNLASLSFLPSTSILLCILRTALLGFWLKLRKKLSGKLNGMSVSHRTSEIKVRQKTSPIQRVWHSSSADGVRVSAFPSGSREWCCDLLPTERE